MIHHYSVLSVCVQIHIYNFFGHCLDFLWWGRREEEWQETQLQWKITTESTMTPKYKQTYNRMTYTRITYKGHLTLSWTVMQLAASFWRISVTPLESLSYLSLGSSSLSSSCTESRENDSCHGFICPRLKTYFLRGTQRWFPQWLSITTTIAQGKIFMFHFSN